MPFACTVWYDITQSWQTKAPRAKSSLQPVFINKVLLAHNHALIYILSVAAFMLQLQSQGIVNFLY